MRRMSRVLCCRAQGRRPTGCGNVPNGRHARLQAMGMAELLYPTLSLGHIGAARGPRAHPWYGHTKSSACPAPCATSAAWCLHACPHTRCCCPLP